MKMNDNGNDCFEVVIFLCTETTHQRIAEENEKGFENVINTIYLNWQQTYTLQHKYTDTLIFQWNM